VGGIRPPPYPPITHTPQPIKKPFFLVTFLRGDTWARRCERIVRRSDTITNRYMKVIVSFSRVFNEPETVPRKKEKLNTRMANP
jgi:hypothetical protein